MRLWRYFKNKFIWVNNKDPVHSEITRLVGLAFHLLQGENDVEARALLLRALQHESKIANPKLLKWILASLWKTWEQTEDYQDSTKFFSDFLVQNPNRALASVSEQARTGTVVGFTKQSRTIREPSN